MQNKVILDNYLILKTLGTGYTGKVKLGRDMNTGELRALKILDPSQMDEQKLSKVIKSLENELNVMTNLNHKNIVKFIGLYPKGEYRNKKGTTKRVAYAVIELASKGEIFEVLFKIGPFNENMARYYMKQLVSALEYLHANKIAHRDLKPENLLLDEDMNLKLADFGFATVFTDDQKNKTKLGTERYMSPELLNKKPYSASKADIFAAGVILFIFYSGHPPFHEGRPEDPYYNVFMQKREKFWDFHSKQNKKRNYSDNYKALINGMLEFDPEKRFTIEQVRDSQWLNEPVDDETAVKDMMMYFQAMMKVLHQSEGMEVEKTHNFRALNDNHHDEVQRKGGKNSLLPTNLDKIVIESVNKDAITSNTLVIDCKDQLAFLEIIMNNISNIPEAKLIWNDNKDKFKIKLLNDYGDVTIVRAYLYQIDNKLYGIDLLREQGSIFDFYKLEAQLRELIIGKTVINDS